MEVTVADLREYFITRDDTFALQIPSELVSIVRPRFDGALGDYCRLEKSIDDKILERHLDGEETIAFYQLSEENKVKNLCFDFDGPGAKHRAKALYQHLVEATEFDESCALEYTGRFFHSWIFFDNKVSARYARNLGKELAKEAGVLCEVFPKQAEATNVGNAIRLPFGKHTVTKDRSVFLEKTLPEIKPIEIVEEEQTDFPQVPEREDTDMDQEDVQNLPCWDRMEKGVQEGRRDEVAFALARHYYDKSLGKEQLKTLMLDWNEKNEPPLPESQIEKKVDQVWSNEYGVGCSSIQNNELLYDFCNEQLCPLVDKTTQEWEEDALEFLKREDLLKRIREIYDRAIVGEEDTKLMLFLLGISSIMGESQFGMLQGVSTAGKSYITNNCLKGFDDNRVLDYSRITERGPEYSDKDYSGKILFIQELGGIGAQETLRVWQSEGGLKVLRGPMKAGEDESQEMEIKGTPTFFTTTTSLEIDSELKTRVWILNPDVSKKQTRRIVEHQAKQAKEEVEKPEYELLKTAVNMLEEYDVKIPYAEKIKKLVPLPEVETRRDHDKLLTLIKLMAFLHQKQRTVVEMNGEEKLVASRVDFLYAIRAGINFFKATVTGLTPGLFEVMRKCEELQGAEMDITSKKIASRTRYTQSRANDMLQQLVEEGYLTVDKESRAYYYSVLKKPTEYIEQKVEEVKEEIKEYPVEDYISRYKVLVDRDTPEYVDPLSVEELPESSGRKTKKALGEALEEKVEAPQDER